MPPPRRRASEADTRLLVAAIVAFLLIAIIVALSLAGQAHSARQKRERGYLDAVARQELSLSVVPRLHESVETRAYNPSCLLLSSGVLVRSFRVSSFSKCRSGDARSSSEKAEELYRTDPGTLGSRIVLSYRQREILLRITEPPRVPYSSLRYVPGYEDARLVEWNSRLLLVANARRDDALGRARVHLVDICAVEDLDRLESPHPCRVALLVAPDEKTTGPEADEKNWAPLILPHSARLLLVRSLVPRRILEVTKSSLVGWILGAELRVSCIVASSEGGSSALSHLLAEMPNGEELPLRKLRGGTQHILVRDCSNAPRLGGEESLYLGLGHFRAEWGYYAAFYALEARLPLSLKLIGYPLKIGDLKGKSHDVEYVTGLRAEASGAELVVSYGLDDCSAAEVRFSTRQVLETLHSPSTLPERPRVR
jgi:hypothetical protein